MRWFSILAIFFLFWFLALFAVLPFAARAAAGEPDRDRVPGAADGAPPVFRPWPIVWRTTLSAVVLTAIFYAIYRAGWIDVRLPANAVDRLPG